MVEGYLGRARRGLAVAAEGTIVDDAPRRRALRARRRCSRDVPPGHPLAQEEIFGPVQVVIPFDDEAEAVAIANGTPYGLVAGGLDPRRRAADAAGAGAPGGQVFLNNYGAGGGVELPFGGVGRSGHGREKGFEALYGFTRLKTVVAGTARASGVPSLNGSRSFGIIEDAEHKRFQPMEGTGSCG